MKLIKPYFEIWEQPAGLEGVYKQIEKVGRVCYKSEDKITEDSAKPFVDRMIKSGHGAMLEHGTVYLHQHQTYHYDGMYGDDKYPDREFLSKYAQNKYSEYVRIGDEHYATTNMRVLVENGWLDDLKYICEPTEYHERRVTVHFVCDRGVSHEFVRHRVMSFAQESTRYCNYSKDKFGNELTFIIPCWLDIPEGRAYFHDGINYRVGATMENPFGESVNFKAWVNKKSNYVEVHDYIQALDSAEEAYFRLMDKWENRVADRRYITGFKGNPWTPQQARAVLPNSLKTELVVTGFTSDWNHFFDLRARGTTGAPHPQAKELAEPLMREFVTRKYINN
jgi:thymidylate synthase (FAD)|nr:MAG TPA: Thymidylate synthase complementing protein [Crassvirales sp.]